MWTEETLMQARDQHEDWLMQQDGVVGTMLGYDTIGRLCLRVLTDHMDAKTRSRIAERFQSIPLDFEDTGPMEARPGPE